MTLRLKTLSIVALLLATSACATMPSAPVMWEGFRDHPHGYLAKGQAPDASAFLPPPPAEGSLRQQSDVETYRSNRALEGSDRWRQAAADNEIETPSAPRVFNEALGVDFDPTKMPTLALLLGRMLGDLETIQTPAKQGYFRPRPFVAEPLPTCITPEPWLGRSGSYPSGHSALGWAWALVLSELAPDRADAILARGLAYGESRVICGVHYASDVEAGRLVGAVIVARLHADPAFRRDLEQARRELATQRRLGS